MPDPNYPLFPIFTFLGFILAIIPLPWHLQAWNSATCFYMMWASLACFNQFVNSVVWANNALNPAPIWCDISTRIILAVSVGVPASALCIMRRLYHIASVQQVSISKTEKRQAIAVDCSICVGLPMLCLVLAYVVEGHRSNIYEEIGCFPAIYNTLATYFLVHSWPLTLGSISAVYCILALRAFAERRAQFNEFLSSNKSSLTLGRYFRLMALAATELMFTIPFSIFSIYVNRTAQPLEPWVSWESVHLDFSRVEQVPSVIWHMNPKLVLGLHLTQWFNPMCAFIFFGYFGFASEARRNYKAAYLFVARRLGLPTAWTTSTQKQSLGGLQQSLKMPSLQSLPAYEPPQPQSCSRKSSFSATDDVAEKGGYAELSTPPQSALGDGSHNLPDILSSSSLSSPTELSQHVAQHSQTSSEKS